MVEHTRAGKQRNVIAGLLGLALLAGLAGCGGAQGSAGGATGASQQVTPAGASTHPPTVTPSGPGAWQTLKGCANTPDAIRVRYDASVEEQKGGPTQVSLRRSDDCGATWTNLNPPEIPGVSYATNVDTMVAFPSPLNARTAFLMVQAEPTEGCATTAPRICQPQFVTTDGGVTWRPLSMPVTGILAIVSNTDYSIGALLHPQGARLYGRLTDTVIGSSGVLPPGRLVASDDGGRSWHVSDAPLAARGLGIWDYAVAPSGSMVFATAEPFNDPASQPPDYGATLSLWASPDGGVTWKQMANPSGGGIEAPVVGMYAGVTQDGRTAVYADVEGQAGTAVMGSLDGGVSWQTDSNLTVPASAATGQPVIAGSLPDGSVIMVYPDNGGPVRAWLPGFPSRPIAGSPSLDLLQDPVVQQRGGVTYLWLIGTAPSDPNSTRVVMYSQLNV